MSHSFGGLSLAFFFLLAVAALPVAACYVDQGKNAIVITQEVVTGDPKAASGIVLLLFSDYYNSDQSYRYFCVSQKGY